MACLGTKMDTHSLVIIIIICFSDGDSFNANTNIVTVGDNEIEGNNIEEYSIEYDNTEDHSIE